MPTLALYLAGSIRENDRTTGYSQMRASPVSLPSSTEQVQAILSHLSQPFVTALLGTVGINAFINCATGRLLMIDAAPGVSLIIRKCVSNSLLPRIPTAGGTFLDAN
jgi:hypothetical protein